MLGVAWVLTVLEALEALAVLLLAAALAGFGAAAFFAGLLAVFFGADFLGAAPPSPLRGFGEAGFVIDVLPVLRVVLALGVVVRFAIPTIID